MKILNWKRVWEEFDEWADKVQKEGKCKTCGHKDYGNFEWEDQQKAIVRIVNRQLREEK